MLCGEISAILYGGQSPRESKTEQPTCFLVVCFPLCFLYQLGGIASPANHTSQITFPINHQFSPHPISNPSNYRVTHCLTRSKPDKIKARKPSPIYQQQIKKSFSMAKYPCFLSLASPCKTRQKSPYVTIPATQ